jgi:hypothetical protein
MNVDRELQAALDVDPSPEFVARVRQRIAAEPAPQRWRAWWLMAAADAAAAVVVAAVVVMRWPGPADGRPTLLTARALPVAADPIDAGSPKGLRYGDSDGVGAAVARAAVARAAVAQPFRAATAAVGRPEGLRYERPPAAADILIDPRERATLVRLIANVGRGRVELNAMLGPSPFSVAEPAPTDDIQIAPISIEPLEPGGEGARQ